MAAFVLPFEKPLVDLVQRLRELRELAATDRALQAELRSLETEMEKVAREIFAGLSPWEKVQLSRHPARPYTLDYIERLFTDFQELHGDRAFAEDASIVAGLARFQGRSVVVVGHQKGRGSKENIKRNFGMPHPEGYRKARRLYGLASRFGLPIVTFIDTPGAYPGLGAEERGQGEAIGACISAMMQAPVPIVATILGEGGSGGALALGVANRVHVLEYGTYSVISPEGCASILWKDGAMAPEAAARLRMTAPDLLELGIADLVLPEPPGGAHQNPAAAADAVGHALEKALGELRPMSPAELLEDRYQKYRRMGVVLEGPASL